ncbi:phosphonate ABC transporter, permease protein PhnE [Granulicatella sp. zg-ZJ]|uniref:phosphonate ABC transporter, permease protein PhnE n=1 Tax=unclassified Granulicatella TaxID=2630493 RepID=UPI0013C07975|nr:MULTISPECIES: phosphonate ABC transporter, permease protein PhnE [unclassified Granulicatella]MBS4750102.1 phosphonate ABC transporter, permease protein PhnE [Carnobacteriaceae bacterium zg-ZUI78]NEW62145.1 phosphonate ABC transporter, permease protein PhnE [Granulicatella sp. zg-ZJ]NEW66599.1 phosphonate ABC transporter, permease protein PhnE [Granulicatella sp. zg-84]QMI86250.1 phosphonate ABC transporter, permease protein PhnE [Carnobacteriaceae bacterium zg-84]
MKTIKDSLIFNEQIVLNNGKTILRPRSKTPLLILGLLICIIISLHVTQFDADVFENSANFFDILVSMFPPDMDYTNDVLPPLFDTVKMSFVGSFLGAVCSLPVAILAANNITKNKFINGFFKLFLSVLRTLPSLVIALIATYIWGLGTFAGTVAIFIFSLSYVGKLLYESIETVDMGAFECMESMGFTRFYAFRYAVLPIILPSFISTALFNFEGNVRYAAILGYVGAGGIGLILNEKLGWRDYSKVGTIIVLLLITVFIIETVSEHFRDRLE